MNKINTKKIYYNEYSLVVGVLCLMVVYLHSSYAKGFNIYTLSTGIKLLERVVSLLLFTVVPMFFILWGYLSEKYLKSNENGFNFFKRKFIQFYPIYFASYFVNIIYKYDEFKNITHLKKILALLGLYYDSFFTGGHIYFVVFSCFVTMSLFMYFNISHKNFILYLFILVGLLKFSEREQDFYIVRYFGYYVAYFIGVFSKHYELLTVNNKKNAFIVCFLLILSLLSIFSELIKYIYLEISYCPNSPEQLCFSLLVLIMIVNFVRLLQSKIPKQIYNFLTNIGSLGYVHFIIHIYIIKLIIYMGDILKANKVIVQIIVIISTSFITIYIIYPIWNKIQQKINCILS